MTLITKKAIPLAASLLLLAGSPAFAATYSHRETRTPGLAATYAPHLTPRSIHTDNSRHYCLSSDSGNDCGFTTLGQCEATASGGLGVCNMVP
jgi:hypothetical protein